MLEIIVIVFVCIHNKNLAVQKKLKPFPWIMYTIAAWVTVEIIGLGLAVFVLNISTSNLLGLTGIGLFSGFGGYLIVRAVLEKKADPVNEDDIDRIRAEDLQPPPKDK